MQSIQSKNNDSTRIHIPKPQKANSIAQGRGTNSFQNALEPQKNNGFLSALQSPLQPKLSIGQANDHYEQEADQIAEQVVSSAPSIQRKCAACEAEESIQTKSLASQITPLSTNFAQKKCAACEAEEELQGKFIQMNGGGGTANNELESQINQHKGAGSTMDSGTQSFMSNSFGADFSNVRIHTGTNSVQMNQELGAKAFTVGNDIHFNQGQYNPGSTEGRKLIAHELTHTIQQGASGRVKKEASTGSARGLNEEELQTKRDTASGRGRVIQRELATPPPAVAPAAQPDLTAQQIQDAIVFNRSRFNDEHTRQIQDIVGTTPTGNWVDEDIRQIGQIQEQYGLQKDGKIGTETFRFLDTEIHNEGLDQSDENCLVSFNIPMQAENIVPRNNGATMTRQFSMRAQFPTHCNCADFEYRQFIRGHFTHERAGVVTDEGNWFANLPAGRINAGWQEDGHTAVPSVNFGHRNRGSEPDNRYLNDAGAVDMRNGCRYFGEDTPGGNYGGWNEPSPTTGDILDILVQFRGEVRRNGRVVRSRIWTALRRRFTLP